MNKLPRGYISYSAYYLWKTNRDAYRRRYYEDEPPFETVETRFGKQVADWLESDDPRVKHIPNYKSKEYNLEVMLEGTLVRGRLDGFDEEEIRFLDHKSSHKTKDGKVPWDNIKVRKLEQLPFYSMMLQEKFGRVKNLCHLVWIETEFKSNTVEVMGHTLEAKGRELVLTGKFKKFSRNIRQFERDKVKQDLLIAIKEIEEDYENYKRTNNK